MHPFDVQRPKTLQEAVALLAAHEDAKVLAGGHSLIPVMKLRLAAPTMLVDLTGIEELRGITVSDDAVTVGAMTCHRDVADSELVRAVAPTLAAVAAHIGDPQVRNAGSIGGSLATNDPNADYPAAILGLDATIVTTKRRIAADDYFAGLFETVLEHDELITSVIVPREVLADYQRHTQPASGFALVGVLVSRATTGVRICPILA